MLPSSVAAPVAQTRTRPRPRVTAEPAYTIDVRSASGVSAGRAWSRLATGQRLAGQRRLVDLEALLVHDAGVGRDTLALGDEQDVAGHDLLGRDLVIAPSRTTTACWVNVSDRARIARLGADAPARSRAPR